MRVVVRASRAGADPSHAETLEHRQRLAALRQCLVHVVVEQTKSHLARLARRLGHAVTIFGFAVRNRIEDGEPDADDQSGNGRADAFDHLPHESHPVFQRPAVAAGPVARAKQFVAEVPVALLHIDEPEPGAVREPRRGDEIVDQVIKLFVGEHAHFARHPPIEYGMMRRRQRRGPIPRIRPREPA